jgi:hypothetical protein
MEKRKRTFSFYGNSELDDLLREFQHKNNIESKSKAIKLLLDTGLRNWSPPEEAGNYDDLSDEADKTTVKDKHNAKYYVLTTGSKR